ncbi:zf-TFIIB domain-containing protein [Chelatococcus sp. GCM10030263]|uniref:TFIIB-type zinc ribbon-containing protein n=1 Tax=Chelatococcus sp. GCM10030263 TaxID=3273387 RepID=UPI003610ABA2
MTNPAVGMPCPVCRVPLVMSERQGVEIDYCPQCRGVWLDRGELDKIIERNVTEAPPPRAAAPAHNPGFSQPQHVQPQYPQGHHPQGEQPHYGQGYPKRKKSFLQELFD